MTLSDFQEFLAVKREEWHKYLIMNYFIQKSDMCGTRHAPATLPLVPIEQEAG